MILREVSMHIKVYAEDGMSITKIARRLGVCRQTVYNHLKRDDHYTRSRKKRASKLDPFKDYIRMRLEHFDLSATSLLRELRKKGYEGGITILRDFVRPIKAEFIQRVTERFETLPGRQAQMDWGECGTIEVDGERRKLYVFVMVLGYSRMMYAQFTTSMKQPVLLRCMKGAFEALGVSTELLVDNMKQAVDEHDTWTGKVKWNRTFLAFCDHYGTLPVACPPYWPRVKGKVERGVGYIKNSFLTGRSFTDLADLNHQLQAWLDTVANVRVHGTTRERPVDRWQQELSHLGEITSIPDWDTREVKIRKVPPDCHISLGATLYSVDPSAEGKAVKVRLEGEYVGDRFSVYLEEELVGEHRIAPKGTVRCTLPEHAAAIQALTRGGRLKAANRRAPKQRFIQQTGNVLILPASGIVHTPEVQRYELDLYDRLAVGS
ncbi:MAG: IS21 family transposase [bacterium]